MSAAIDSQANLIIGIVTVSDRASRGEYVDAGGPAIDDYLREVLDEPFETLCRIVPDEVGAIASTLIELVDQADCRLVVTTGGTGPAVRDVTPDATEMVCEKLLPGFGERMRQVSLQYVPTAILSRQTAGVRSRSLLINLPGQPKAIAECLDSVFAAIPYATELISGRFLQTNQKRFVAFRPKSAG